MTFTSRHDRRDRRGAIVVMVAFMLIILLLMTAISVDVAYMQLVRTELRAATDAAAKAGAESLSSDQNGDLALSAAQSIALANQVAGEDFELDTDDIELGRSVQQADGTWQFVAELEPYNSVRATGRRTDDSPLGTVNLMLGSLFGAGTFAPTHAAVATQLDQDVVLVVDRSHSMCWDLSNNEWSYPPSIPDAPDAYCTAPDPTESRWAAMQGAVDVFVASIIETAPTEYLSLVTFASDYTSCDKTVTASTVESQLSSNYSDVPDRLTALGTVSMPGGTNIDAGIQAGESVLTGPTARVYTQKTMIVFTDGRWTAGVDPVGAAAAAAEQGIHVHTVTFSKQADKAKMKEVAKAGNGRHFHANNEKELKKVFREIAYTLPIVLTK